MSSARELTLTLAVGPVCESCGHDHRGRVWCEECGHAGTPEGCASPVDQEAFAAEWDAIAAAARGASMRLPTRYRCSCEAANRRGVRYCDVCERRIELAGDEGLRRGAR